MKVFLISGFIAICFVLISAYPSLDIAEPHIQPNFDTNPNCTMCETIYNLILKNVKPAEIANEGAARSYLFGECNYFRQVGAPFWPFCFELYTDHFQQAWDDLKTNVTTPVACAGFGLC